MRFILFIPAAILINISSVLPATSVHESLNIINGNSGDASTTPFYVTTPLKNTTNTASSTYEINFLLR